MLCVACAIGSVRAYTLDMNLQSLLFVIFGCCCSCRKFTKALLFLHRNPGPRWGGGAQPAPPQACTAAEHTHFNTTLKDFISQRQHAVFHLFSGFSIRRAAAPTLWSAVAHNWKCPWLLRLFCMPFSGSWFSNVIHIYACGLTV